MAPSRSRRALPFVVFLAATASLAPVSCGKSAAPPEGKPSGGVGSADAIVAPPPPLVAPSASVSASAGPRIASAPPRPAVPSRCCRVERKEGKYGPENAIHTSYAADIVTRANGDRFLGNEDIVSDTAELLDYAKGMKRSLSQQRRILIIGETSTFVSLSIDDVGDTGSGTTAKHSGCKTLRIGTAAVAKPDDALTPEGAARVIAIARKAVASAGPGFRFGPLSWALLDAGVLVRFCAAEEGDSGGRFDVDVALEDGELKKGK